MFWVTFWTWKKYDHCVFRGYISLVYFWHLRSFPVKYFTLCHSVLLWSVYSPHTDISITSLLWLLLPSGVPQGSVLGPLFLLLPSGVPQGSILGLLFLVVYALPPEQIHSFLTSEYSCNCLRLSAVVTLWQWWDVFFFLNVDINDIYI